MLECFNTFVCNMLAAEPQPIKRERETLEAVSGLGTGGFWKSNEGAHFVVYDSQLFFKQMWDTIT